MELDTTFVHLCIKNKILVGTYKQNLHINLEVAKEIVRARQIFTGGKKIATLINSQGVVSMDRPAREYLASAEATEGLTACALVVNSSFSSFLGNFFLAVNKTTMPVRIFTSIAKGEKWLQQFIKQP
jgi:hypothetical protein